MIDFKEINCAALALAGPVAVRFAPGGRVFAHEYVALNPRRPDRRIGSFRLNMKTGRWADFATGDRGGDLVSYAAYCADISQSEAARLVASLVGVKIGGLVNG